jgi:hypothetical protein
LIPKSIEYFEGQSTTLKRQQKILKATFGTNRSLVRAPLLVELYIAKIKKSFTIAEDLIKSYVVDVCAKFWGNLKQK